MPTSYKHFSTDERESLLVMLTKNWTQSEMARELRRSESSISRELKRNRGKKGEYSPAKAADAYKQRRKNCGRPKKLNDPKLKKKVEERLEMNWSPEQIDGRFRLETGVCQISYATIYRAYVMEERPIDEVAAEFGVPNNTVSQTKTRVARMIAAHEALLGE